MLIFFSDTFNVKKKKNKQMRDASVYLNRDDELWRASRKTLLKY